VSLADTELGSIPDLIRGHARARPAHPALVLDEERLDFAGLDALMDRVAAALQRDGLGPGDAHPLVELDRRLAIRAALHEARPGDVVVIAGKGHESGQTAHGVTVPFDDRVVASEELEARLCQENR